MASNTEPFQLQILHSSDMESGIPALKDAVNFSAVVNGLKNTYDNTLILSSGDNYIPGPFFSASSDRSLRNVLGREGVGRADIQIMNEIGYQASAFGNHEFDLGTSTVAELIASGNGYAGTQFPYLSTNLNFAPDANLARFVVPDAQAPKPNSISGSVVLTVGSEDTNRNGILDSGEDKNGDGILYLGERIGIVGATTPTLRSISSPGNVAVSPANPTDYDALAAEIQSSVDELTATGINKVVLLAHMQQLNIEETLAGKLRDVDVIIAGGSHTLLANPDDPLRLGDTSTGSYPIQRTSASGQPTLVVNTASNWEYVGRLVVDFDANGLITDIDDKTGAYATDDRGVDAVYGSDVDPRVVADPQVVAITDALGTVINSKDSKIFGETDVFLNGRREDVRTQETNLGNLTADANLFVAQQVDPTTVISLKNGGGIRDNIGTIQAAPGSLDPNDFVRLPPPANPQAGKEEGDVSQLDIENSLRFNNNLSLVTVSAQQLLQVMEHAVAGTGSGTTPGQFPQVGGMAFSFDADSPVGGRIQSLAIKDTSGNTLDVVVSNGELVGDPNRTFRMVTLSFLATGGDGYPFPTFASTLNKVDLTTPGVRTGAATFADDGTEQDAFAEYMAANFNTTPFSVEDVSPAQDTRIQNLDFRTDLVLSDIITGGNGNDDLFGTNGADTVIGGGGNDRIFGSEGVNTLVGGNGDDIIYGGSQSDRIEGGNGNDLLYASEGSNTILAGAGNDTIYTGSGNDLIDGGAGNDTIWLGGGRDTIVLVKGSGVDTINNFQVGQSSLGLSAGLTFNDLTLAQGEGATLISTGDELLASLSWVQASSLSASNFVTV